MIRAVRTGYSIWCIPGSAIPIGIVDIHKFIWNLRLQAPEIEDLGERIQQIIPDECAENELTNHTQDKCARTIAY